MLQNLLASLKNTRFRVVCAIMLLALTAAFVAFGTTSVSFADEKDSAKETTATETKADDAAKDDAKDAAATDEAATDAQADAPATTELPEDAFLLGNDIMWFGRENTFTELVSANDIIGAGETVTVSSSSAGGSIRLAARVVNVDNTVVGESVTLAGQDVGLTNVTANVMALAAQRVNFSGAANELWVVGETVIINGAVMGNVHVEADKLELGPNANIQGTMSGKVGSEPTIDEGAIVGENTVTIEKHEEEENQDFVAMLDPVFIAVSVLSAIAIALLCEWLAGGHTVGAASLIKSGVGGYLITSVLSVLIVPIAIVLMCVPVVTLPAALATFLTVLAIALISEGFMSAVFGRLLFPNMNRFLAAGIMGLFIGALSALPYAGHPIRFIVFTLMLGYVVRSLRVTMIERRRAREEEVIQF